MDNNRELISNIIYLINCSLQGISADLNKYNKMDIKKIKTICKEHKISALVSLALKQSSDYEYWEKQKNNAIRNTVLFDCERANLFNYLNNDKIWYLPLKGIVISKYYPEYGIREFSDNDILFDKTYREKIRDYFVYNGYSVKEYNTSNHDTYEKDPVYEFEMHTSLFGDNVKPQFQEYFNNTYQRAIRIDDSYELYLNNNDLYIYIMAHAVKHYTISGTGLRTLIDIYLLTQNLDLDYRYINKELKKIGILNEANELRDLSLELFDKRNTELTDEQYDTLSKIVNMGVYGNLETRVDQGISRLGLVNYIVERLFIPTYRFKTRHPIVYKNKILLPLFYIWRFLRGITVKGKQTLQELKYIIRHK